MPVDVSIVGPVHHLDVVEKSVGVVAAVGGSWTVTSNVLQREAV